ncbi:MAG: glycoside hydrolase family 15 protein [Verrucomicrobiota bacterium]
MRSTRVDGYAPIREYAAIGDGRTVALVAADGSIDWLTLPTISGPAVFSALLDAERGACFELRPDGEFEVERAYLEETNVLRTRFRTTGGTLEVTDALTLQDGGLLPWFELVRRLEAPDGDVPVRWRVRPRFDFARRAPKLDSRNGVPVLVDGRTILAVRSFGAGEPVATDDEVAGRCTIRAGDSAMLCLLSVDNEPIPLPPRDEIETRIDGTCEAWRRWADGARYEGPHRTAVVRSALVLKLLIYAPSGAMAAAPTTSLPEKIGGGRNYDYRYAWVRDASFALDALMELGYREQAHDSLSWLLDATRRSHPRLQPMYSLSGDVLPEQEELPLAGYRGSRPVLRGNRAAHQIQLGAYGELLETIALYVEQGNALDRETAVRVREIVDLTCEIWRNEDSGMWELPEERHYTVSKIACWCAIERALQLAGGGQVDGDRDRWRAEQEAIRTFVDERCWSDSRCAYAFYAGTDDLDASLLRFSRSLFFERERLASTVDAIRDELAEGPLLYRYSGMRGQEGAFLACSFWLVGALATLGRVDEAEALFGELLERANDVGLYSEEMDPESGEMLGNFPQGLTHLAVIDAAYDLEEARNGTS